MDTQEAFEIISSVSPSRLSAALEMDADPDLDWSAIPAADRDIITAACWFPENGTALIRRFRELQLPIRSNANANADT